MASPGHEYLPELARCFTGDASVFSWSKAFRWLTETETGLNRHALVSLASSPKVKNLLAQKVPAFPLPSQQARNQLETEAAAVKVTSPSGGSYDIGQIKQDSLWLAEEVKLAEDEALRIVMLEWQQRPAEVLAAGYSEAEIASLRDALGRQDAETGHSIEQILQKRDEGSFNIPDIRRARLLNVYFEEELGLLAVARRIQEMAFLKENTAIDTDSLLQFVRELDHTASANVGTADIVDAIESRLQALGAGKNWSLQTDDINDHWVAAELLCILTLQELLLLRIRNSPETVSTDSLLRWLQVMGGCEFFANVQPGPLLLATQVESLQAISSLVTLAMMDPATAMETLADSTSIDPSSYFLNGDAAHDLHRFLLTAAEACIPQATPSAFAWALILNEIKRQGSAAKESRESGAVQRAIDQGVATFDTATGRRTSSGSLQSSVYEDVLSSIMNTSDMSDPAAYLLRCTIEAANVFETINILSKEREYRSTLISAISLQILQELVFVAVSSLGYTSEILDAQFSLLSTIPSSKEIVEDPRVLFINNYYLMDNIFAVAAGRFPYETLPFLRLCRLLASAEIYDEQGTQYIAFRLRKMESFTQSAIGPFASYHTVREDENLNLVALNSTVSILQGTQRRQLVQSQLHDEPTMIILVDTLGEVISESSPPVIRWRHSYSGLALLGSWLELHYLGQLQTILSPSESIEDVITESISILTTLLQNTTQNMPQDFSIDDKRRLQDELLEEASSVLQNDMDIGDYVFEILEQELQAYRRRPSNIFNTSILVACIEFATVFSQIRPDQFWTSFSKSSLLESYGSDSFLLSIVLGVEVPNQTYPFCHACTKLYGRVITAVLQKSQTSNQKVVSKFNRKFQPQSLRLCTNVLTSLTRSLYGAFEALPGWAFVSKGQQNRIIADLTESFQRVVVCSNAVEVSTSNLTSPFFESAGFLVQQTRSETDDLSSTTSLVRHLFRIEESHMHTNRSSIFNEDRGALRAILSLSATLVKLGKLRMKASSQLDQQLFNAIPLLCRVLSVSTETSAIDLSRHLLDTVAKSGPFSLLGHLGSTSAVNFLQILKSYLEDWTSTNLKSSVWELLAKLVGRNQQWLAIVILTGSPPEKTRKHDDDNSEGGLRGRGFMEIAIRQLTKIAELDQSVAIAILNFMINAQTNWSWANEAMKSDKDFLPAILSYVCNTYVDASDELRISYRNKIAALVTDLTTIHLHHAKAKRDTTTVRTITPLLRWLTENAIDVASYNHSLHTNLRKNFASRFEGLEVVDFKRTGLVEAGYGNDYYYDTSLANEVLQTRQQWDRRGKHRDQSFSAEFRRANLNLSVVDSEVNLLTSLLNLCLEHSGYLSQDPEVQKIAVGMVRHCLDASTLPCPPEKIFDSVLQTRADISIALLQRLIDVKASGSGVRALLTHAWECARANNGSFEQAITDNNLVYWRSVLTITLMTLQFQVDKRYMPPAADSSPAALLRHTEQAIPTILDIITVVIGQGFRSVAANLRDQHQAITRSKSVLPNAASHKDIHLILTIFDTILRMTRLPEFVSEASQRLIAEGAIQSCLLLFSWSHTLTGPEFDNEPIYANYCLQFLSSLSSLPPVTEELAVEGVLTRLLSSRITQKLQAVPDGAAHLDRRPHVQTLYNLWATGLLPVCLNLLHSVGAPVAAEVSIFLNQFANQLNRASVAFVLSASRTAGADSITSTVASEAATLALISFILSSFRNAGASAAVDPSTILGLAGYDEHKKALSEDISDVIGSTSASLKARIVPVNEKEVALSREGDGTALVKKVLSRLQDALTCLKGEEAEDDK